MNSEVDCTILQNDINYLDEWCKSNQMKFHPDKCKVVSIITKNSKDKLAYLSQLPLSRYCYTLGSSPLDYEANERDLGVIISSNFCWDDQHNQVINKASQMLGLTKRTCHFLINSHRKRTLYLAMVRSQFQHCSVIWRPGTITQIHKFEALQKNAIKWILNEDFISYSDNETYIQKCRQIDLLPISKMFDLNDLKFFHKIVHDYVPIRLPEYISKFEGVSRLRENHLDSECYTCNLNHPNISSRSPIFRNYFYRVIHIWNKLPYESKIDNNTKIILCYIV